MEDSAFSSGEGSRDVECEEAMWIIFSAALATAVEGGWTESQAAYFLAEAADRHILDRWRGRPNSRPH